MPRWWPSSSRPGGVAWEVLFVDDDSPDGTTVRPVASPARSARALYPPDRPPRPRLGGDGRRARRFRPFIAVMDGDLQHDETRLPVMLAALRPALDLAVASRHIAGGDAAGPGSGCRRGLSDAGIASPSGPAGPAVRPDERVLHAAAPVVRAAGAPADRTRFQDTARPRAQRPRGLRVARYPGRFRARSPGKASSTSSCSRNSPNCCWTSAGRVGAAAVRRFAAVGALGVGAIWRADVRAETRRADFGEAQAVATVVAMVFNFVLNNQITYRDQLLKGPRSGRASRFSCGVRTWGGGRCRHGSRALFAHTGWTLSGATGGMIGFVWNYAVSATLVWRAPMSQEAVPPGPRQGPALGTHDCRVSSGLAATPLVLGSLTAVRWPLPRVPLSPDEAYYWVWSRHPPPGYLDAPPMVALWIRAGTVLAGDGALGVRLLGPLSVGAGLPPAVERGRASAARAARRVDRRRAA